jgi:sensor histidine kinase regulating citrate/malate metabolism
MKTFLDVFPSVEHQLLFILNLVLLILLNLYLTRIIDTMSRNNLLENELNLYQQQQVIQARYYENLEQKYDSTRTLVHDIRNHIQAIEHLHETESTPEGLEYVRDIHEMLNQLNQTYYTTNKMLNIILNDKVQQMNALGIQEDIKIAEVDLNFLRNIDITTLFSNILDNAIEASAASTQKVLSLRITTTHDFISITLRNSTDQPPILEGNSYRSSKKNHEGLGLKNVERVVNQYKGDVQYEWKDAYFITRIMLAG